MAGIKLGEFRGVRPRLSARLLDSREGQVAFNVRLGSGELRPLRENTLQGTWAKTGAIRTLFAYDHPTQGRLWLHWPQIVDVVPGPNHNDLLKRVYYTGDGVPKMSFSTIIADGAGTQYPYGWRRLGVPAPPPMTGSGDEADPDYVAPVAVDSTQPIQDGVITAITGATGFENTSSTDYWNTQTQLPLSFAWYSGFGMPPPTIEMALQAGDQFVVERVSATTIRLQPDRQDYLVPTAGYERPGFTSSDHIFYRLTGIYHGRTNTDGTSGGLAVGVFDLLRPANGSRVEFPQAHGLRSGEIIRITEINTPLRGQAPALFQGISGSLSSPRFWESTTQMTWQGEAKFSVVRDGSVDVVITDPVTGEETAVPNILENRAYTYTYVTDLGEEGPPAKPTKVFTVGIGDGVELYDFQLPTDSDIVIESIRLYRTDTNATEAEFRLVAEITVDSIVNYVAPDPESIHWGGEKDTAALPTLASTTEETIVAIDEPLLTAGGEVTLEFRFEDYRGVFGEESPTTFTNPEWSVLLQYSTNGTHWTGLGNEIMVGTAQNNTDDTTPVTYNGGFHINKLVTRTVSGLPEGGPVYVRAVVNYTTGSHHQPLITKLRVTEPPIDFETTPQDTFSYRDSKRSFQLAEILESTTWFPPHENMHSLATMPNGMLIGAYGRTVTFCVPYLPHAWPPEFESTIDYDVVGIGVFGNSALICTTGTPYVFSGTNPANVSSRRIEVKQACVSKQSIANVGVGVLYATPDGLAFASMQGFSLITEGHFSREEWQVLNPETMVGFSHDDKYICFYDGGCFIFDPQKPEVGLSFAPDDDIVGGFEDLLTDTLYLSNGSQRLTWDTDTNRTYKWRSKRFGMPYPINPAACRVLAGTYPVTFRLYAHGVLKHQRVVSSKDAFRLPSGYMADEFEVELEGQAAVMNVWVGETFTEILEG